MSGRTPIRLVSCEPDGAGHQVAVVELDVITDLPITGRVEVLFEDPQAVELERAIGSFDVIQPGESGQATVTSTAAIGDATTDCLIIGLEREEVVG